MTDRPFVTLKYAASLDGKIATSTGESRWISGEEARRYAHELRDANDAVLVGIGTILADDPQLTTRLDDRVGRQPLRVIVDSRLRIPLTAKVLGADLARGTLVACTPEASQERVDAVSATGAEVVSLPPQAGRVDLRGLLHLLGERHVKSVLVEGGSEVNAALLEARLVDRVEACFAPMLIGGRQAPTPVAGAGVARLADAIRLHDVETRRLGADVLVAGNVRPSQPIT